MKTVGFFFIFCTVSNAAEIQQYRLVNTMQGPVKGYKDPWHNFYAFKGIPYATAPTGLDRFKAPLSPPTWEQPLEAVDTRIVCPQVDTGELRRDQVKQEDCLNVNVYVPDTEENNLPVIFHVYGGAFQKGYGDYRVPKELVTENNIIFVSFNYRLGVHGFLCLGTEDVPGNAGLKDQVAALRWVTKNIASFGGNPDDITLYGSSSGAASVELLMISNTTRGLFNKAILESGAGIAVWATQSDPLEKAKRFAKTLNFHNVDDISALEHFYRTASFDKLTSISFLAEIDATFGFAPCIDRATKGEVFLDRSPANILKSGSYVKVPLLYGFSNMEGLIRVPVFESWKSRMNAKFSDFLPADLKFESEKQKEEIAKQVKEFYFEDKPVGNDNILKYIEYFGDVIISYPMLRSVKNYVEGGNDRVYLYEFSFVDEYTPVVPYTSVKGAKHCAQNWALTNPPPENPGKDFKKMSAVMSRLWGNFIKTGAPVSEVGSPVASWPAVSAAVARSPHMSLDREISLRGPLLERRARFWDDIYSKYYRDPIPPPTTT